MIEKKISHLAVIMDGNRRWARIQGFDSMYGHKKGVDAVKRTIEFCLKSSISYLSLYTFSIENNIRRSLGEKKYLFQLMHYLVEQNLPHFIQRDIRIRFIGDQSLFPESLKQMYQKVEHQTRNGKKLQVNFLFCYGGQQEIIHGVKRIIQKVAQGILSIDQLDENQFNQCLWMENIPAPDMIIRTGGQKRLSNFLLFQAAYAELYFLDCFWPEVTDDHLSQAVSQFRQCQQNFGT